MERDLIVEKKFRIFNRYRWLFELVPYSRNFFVVGSLAAGTAGPESDIDLLVVAKENRVWLNRTLLNIVLFIIGQRRNRRHRANRFCLNASLSEKRIPRSLAKKQSLRAALELFLETTFLALIFEYLARKILMTYIKSRFRGLGKAPDSVLILENQRIIYYPPR